MDENSKTENHNFSLKCAGYTNLFIAIIITIFNCLFVRSIEDPIKKPFSYTYYLYSLYLLLIPTYYIKERIKEGSTNKPSTVIREQETDIDIIRNSVLEENFSEALITLKKEKNHEFEKYSNHIVISLMVLSYFSRALFLIGLNKLKFQIANSLLRLNFLFILTEKLLCFKTKLSKYSIFASIFAFTGIVLFLVHQSDTSFSSKDCILGYTFTFIGAFFLSLYSVLINFLGKKYNEEFDVTLILGFIGLYNLLLIPIFLFSLNIFGGETLEFPDLKTMWTILINCILQGMIPELLYSYSLVFLSPISVGIIMSVIIPFSIICEKLLGQTNLEQKNLLDLYFILGTVFVFMSFIIIIYESLKNHHVRARKSRQMQSFIKSSILPVDQNESIQKNRESYK